MAHEFGRRQRFPVRVIDQESRGQRLRDVANRRGVVRPRLRSVLKPFSGAAVSRRIGGTQSVCHHVLVVRPWVGIDGQIGIGIQLRRIPGRRWSGRGEVRRSTPQVQMPQDLLNDGRIVDDRNQSHRLLAFRILQGIGVQAWRIRSRHLRAGSFTGGGVERENGVQDCLGSGGERTGCVMDPDCGGRAIRAVLTAPPKDSLGLSDHRGPAVEARLPRRCRTERAYTAEGTMAARLTRTRNTRRECPAPLPDSH